MMIVSIYRFIHIILRGMKRFLLSDKNLALFVLFRENLEVFMFPHFSLSISVSFIFKFISGAKWLAIPIYSSQFLSTVCISVNVNVLFEMSLLSATRSLHNYPESIKRGPLMG